jgi:hypothetical protein
MTTEKIPETRKITFTFHGTTLKMEGCSTHLDMAEAMLFIAEYLCREGFATPETIISGFQKELK